MAKLNSLDDLKDIRFEESESDDGVAEVIELSGYKNHSKKIAFTIGYLLGIKDEYLLRICDNQSESIELKGKISKNEDARAVRVLNNIRSNLMLGFKRVSQTIRVTSANYQPLYMMEYFKDDFRELNRLDIKITPSNSQDINEYIKKINEEISRRFKGLKPLFPEWVNFKYIENVFTMPKDIATESKKYQVNQDCYPYKRYFCWEYPEKQGNLLVCDQKILSIIYIENKDTFTEISKVSDVSDTVRYNINDFINRGYNIQIFVDGENVDPYRFAAMIEGLNDHEIKKIGKIVVYYDELYSPKAWYMLKHFSRGIPVEPIGVKRIKEDKSLVDHKLVVGVTKAHYTDGVDSIILASSDSDFWSVIEDVPAKYMVLVEGEKCGNDFKEKMRETNIFYCYLDRFMTSEDDLFFKAVFCHELSKQLEDILKVNSADRLLNTAIVQSRAEVSEAVKTNLFNKYIKGMRLSVDKGGNISITIPE